MEESLENVFYSTFKLDNDDEEKVDRRKVSEKYTHKISSSIAYSSYSLDGSGISKISRKKFASSMMKFICHTGLNN